MKAIIKTNKGDISLNLFYESAPLTVSNFINLSNRGYYNNLTFHRVIPEFVAQGGCPNGTGTGGPGYAIDCETSGGGQFHDKGVLSMAHAGKNTGGSQFFLCHNRHNTQHLDGVHTCFGKVSEGLNVIDSIQAGDKFTITLMD